MFGTQRLRQSSATWFDPSTGASQVGVRQISGDVPSTRQRISLIAWAIIFETAAEAKDRYDHIAQLLVDVGADARIRQPITGVEGETFGNMSERTDLIGQVSTIWVTATTGPDQARGAVLASTGGTLVQLLSTDLYVASGEDRAIYMVEALAERMAARERGMDLSPAADTMARLPILVDVHGLLEDASIVFNQYGIPPPC